MKITSILNPTFAQKFDLKINFKVVWAFLFLLIISLLVFYVFQVNSLTHQIYLIENYQGCLKSLSQENETLKINFSKSNSLANIQNYLANQNFEKAKKVKYIQMLETSVVTR